MLQIPVQAPKAKEPNNAQVAANLETKSNAKRDLKGLDQSVLQSFRKSVFGRESLKSNARSN